VLPDENARRNHNVGGKLGSGNKGGEEKNGKKEWETVMIVTTVIVWIRAEAIVAHAQTNSHSRKATPNTLK